MMNVFGQHSTRRDQKESEAENEVNLTVPRIDDSSYEDYTDHHTKKLFEGTLIERVGSFYPRNRKGFTDSRSELAVRRRMARIFYGKRLQISRSIVHSPYEDPKEILTSSLVVNGVSPYSVDRWDRYIMLLSGNEGCWDRFVYGLSHEVGEIDYLRKKLLAHLTYIITLCLLIFATSTAYIDSDMFIAGIIPFVALIAVVSFASTYTLPIFVRHIRRKRELCGSSKKHYTEMYPATRVV